MTLTPADDHFAIELEGALAGMLALAQTGKGPDGVQQTFPSVPEFDKGCCGGVQPL